jgi:hypothetical protein
MGNASVLVDKVTRGRGFLQVFQFVFVIMITSKTVLHMQVSSGGRTVKLLDVTIPKRYSLSPPPRLPLE